jgi:hypothetical protein
MRAFMLHVADRLYTDLFRLGRTDTWPYAYHRRMRVGLGLAAANTATAHNVATLVYHLLKYREEYIDVDRLAYGQKLNRLGWQAAELACEVVSKK